MTDIAYIPDIVKCCFSILFKDGLFTLDQTATNSRSTGADLIIFLGGDVCQTLQAGDRALI